MSTKYPRTDDSRHLVGGSELVKVYAGRKISRLTRHRRPTASVLNYAFGPSVTMQGVNKCEQYTSIAARGGGGSFKRLKLYNSEEHVPIESFVTTLIH